MSKQVIKKNGAKVPFEPKKITRSITRAAQDAKLSLEDMNEIVNKVFEIIIQFVEPEEKISSSLIRDKILEELEQLDPRVSAEWRRFMNAKNNSYVGK